MLKNQVFLGDEKFVNKIQELIHPDKNMDEVSSSQKRRLPKPIKDYVTSTSSRNDAIYEAYRSGGYRLKEIADYFELHYSSVSKIVKNVEESKFKT
ncbi:MAG: hypothetical protein COA42_17420 [Alteromonadaceae bacterium]|nr:MAG: hypothetical protein COA42_17420 [Alteromonadaceae bacterium]